MFGNVKRAFFKRTVKKPLAVLLSVAMVLTMFPMTAMAASDGDEAYVQLVGKNGEVSTVATWKYSDADRTYIDQSTGKEVAVIKDFTKSENLKGTAFGQSYDFTEAGALPYTGLNMKPDPRAFSVTTKGILLEDLYDYAEQLAGGIDLRGDTAMYLSDRGGYKDEFTYDQYWGLARYYNPKWYDAATYADAVAENGSVVPGTIAVLGYHSTKFNDKTNISSLSELINKADAVKALRITVGMQ